MRKYGELYAQTRLETLESLDKISDLDSHDDLKSKLLFSVIVVSRKNWWNIHQIAAKYFDNYSKKCLAKYSIFSVSVVGKHNNIQTFEKLMDTFDVDLKSDYLCNYI